MIKDYLSDGVLIYDRYYCNRPNTPLLALKRILLTICFCLCSLNFALAQYKLPFDMTVISVLCGVFCFVFSLLFILVRKRYLYPIGAGVFVLAGLVMLHPIIHKLSFFWDFILLVMKGRLFNPAHLLSHPVDKLIPQNSEYVQSVLFGTILLCVFYSLVFSACCYGKIRLLPPLALFALICTPLMVSERLEFSAWLIPAAASLAALFAIGKNYSAGLAVSHGSSSEYRSRLRDEEKSVLKNIEKAPNSKRIAMRCNYYSKYFGAGACCAVLVSICIFVGAVLFPFGTSIDYTEVYDFIAGIGENSGIKTPFDDGAPSQYFPKPSRNEQKQLNIASPGRGNREIIKVTYTGDRPVYLRGDIGVDFTGSGWTTVVKNEPPSWKNSPLKEHYRPCEGRVLYELMLSSGSSGSMYQRYHGVYTVSDVNIEYLCDTDVVFLPPYTMDFQYYNSDSFDVYADFAVRVKPSAGGRIDSVDCTAILPSYTSNEFMQTEFQLNFSAGDFRSFSGIDLNDFYPIVLPEMTQPHILEDYESYVESVYLSIPRDYSEKISEFIGKNLRYAIEEALVEAEMSVNAAVSAIGGQRELTTAEQRYCTALAVSEYLSSNYTYSLNAVKSDDMVMSFLNNTKKGHCALYASAMTLILRELGIPARYCTGFYAENSSGTVVLKEKNVHAWVEVYVGQQGWVTFDPTSSAAYPDENILQNEKTEESEKTAEQEKTPTEESEEQSAKSTEQSSPATEAAQTEELNTSAEAEQPSKPTFWEIIKPFVPFVLIAAAVTALIALWLSKLKALKKSARRALYMLKIGEPTQSSRLIYRLTLKLCELKEITPMQGEMPKDFWKRADSLFDTAFAANLEILEALEFGQSEMSEENHGILYAQLERILNKLKPFEFPAKVKILRIIQNSLKKNEKM